GDVAVVLQQPQRLVDGGWIAQVEPERAQPLDQLVTVGRRLSQQQQQARPGEVFRLPAIAATTGCLGVRNQDRQLLHRSPFSKVLQAPTAHKPTPFIVWAQGSMSSALPSAGAYFTGFPFRRMVNPSLAMK